MSQNIILSSKHKRLNILCTVGMVRLHELTCAWNLAKLVNFRENMSQSFKMKFCFILSRTSRQHFKTVIFQILADEGSRQL